MEELDCEESPRLTTAVTPSPQLLPLQDDRDLVYSSNSNYRDLLALHLSDTHEQLDRLMWAMQDTLDSLVLEGQKQVECLVEIEDLFGAVKKPGQLKNSEKEERPAEEIGTCDTFSSPIPISPTPKLPDTADKATQASEANEDVLNFALLESRHCEYMFEAFHHLRFAMEIVSPVEIERPERSQPIPQSNSKLHAEHRLNLKGTILELNQLLADISIRPLLKSPANSLLPRGKTTRYTVRSSFAFTPNLPLSPRLSIPQRTPNEKAGSLKPRASAINVVLGDSLNLHLNLRLVTTEPFLIQQTRPLPSNCLSGTKVKYAEIEHIQTIMPEIADIRFNISDVLTPEMTPDQFYLCRYFCSSKDNSEINFIKVDENVTNSLHIHHFFLRHRRYFRLLFLSYTMEAMSTVTDLLTLSFPSFIKLLKDCFLLSPDFDLLSCAKVFYLSSVKCKEIPENEDLQGQRKWLKHLLNSYNFAGNYRLRLSGFLEAVVRITHYHPRFQRLTNLTHREKLEILYKRCIKPNARLTQGSYYANLLKDVHVMEVLRVYESQLYEVFQGYEVKLTHSEKMVDFIGKDRKMDLHKYYSFLANSGYLIQADIISIENEDIEQEIHNLNEFHPAKSISKPSFQLRPNQPYNIQVKETTIRFPSSLIERMENANIKLKAAKNTRHNAGNSENVLLSFYRPMRSTLQVDKLTAFSFFVTVLRAGEAVYLLNPSQLGDSDFCIDFREFVEVVGMLGMLYWKTVTNCEGLSMVEGIATFIKSIIDKFRHHTRHFLGFSVAERNRLSQELIRGTSAPLADLQSRPLITKTMIPMDRFLQRRESI